MIANFYSVVVSRNKRESAPAYGPLPTPASSRPPSPSSMPHASGRAPTPSQSILNANQTMRRRGRVYSWIFARISESRKRKYSYVRAKVASATSRTCHESQRITHLLADLDGAAAPTRKEYTVASLHADREDVAVLVGRTWANSDDGRLREGVVR